MTHKLIHIVHGEPTTEKYEQIYKQQIKSSHNFLDSNPLENLQTIKFDASMVRVELLDFAEYVALLYVETLWDFPEQSETLK